MKCWLNMPVENTRGEINPPFLFADFSSHFQCLPNGEAVPFVPRSRPPYSPDRLHSTGRPVPLVRCHSPGSAVRSSPPVKPSVRVRSRSSACTHFPSSASSTEEPPLRVRSMSHHARQYSSRILGYDLKEPRFVRLIPHTNPFTLLETRRYTFPHDEPIQ